MNLTSIRPGSPTPGVRGSRGWSYGLVVLATLFWAGNVIVGRALRDQAGPFTIVAGRMLVAGLVFVPLMRGLPAGHRGLDRRWPWLAAMGLLGMVGCPATLYLALRVTTASSAVLINGAGPLVTALLAGWLLRTRLTRAGWAGLALSLGGVGLVIGGAALRTLAPNRGDLLMIANVVMWGLYSIIARRVTGDRPALWATGYAIWFALPPLLALAALEWRNQPAVVDNRLLLALLYVGLAATCLSYLAWTEGVRRLGPNGAMAFYNLLPFFGVLLAALLLGERLNATQALGGGLIIAGGLLAAHWPGNTDQPAR